MKLIGRLIDIHIDFYTKKPIVSFMLNDDPYGIEVYQDKDIQLSLGNISRRRSLDSNAYFHVLCDKLRQKLGISMARCKNELITSYGQIEYIDDNEPAVIKTNIEPETLAENETLHMKFIKFGDDGAFWYRVYRGSHTYTVEEMQKLIEGTIEECQLYGIETATPEDIAHMQYLWKEKYGSSEDRKEFKE